jgi:hypothetical protein
MMSEPRLNASATVTATAKFISRDGKLFVFAVAASDDAVR